ncbi:MAG: hypothetical protein VX498_06885 [Myxococcota bacterium]|nr:hypothetical protein [Myxococcota bacterium]
MNRAGAVCFFVAGLLSLALACSSGDASEEAKAPAAEPDLHGTVPAAALELPDFAAVNYDGSKRGPEALKGQPTVLWFFPFAGTPI